MANLLWHPQNVASCLLLKRNKKRICCRSHLTQNKVIWRYTYLQTMKWNKTKKFVFCILMTHFWFYADLALSKSRRQQFQLLWFLKNTTPITRHPHHLYTQKKISSLKWLGWIMRHFFSQTNFKKTKLAHPPQQICPKHINLCGEYNFMWSWIFNTYLWRKYTSRVP